MIKAAQWFADERNATQRRSHEIQMFLAKKTLSWFSPKNKTYLFATFAE